MRWFFLVLMVGITAGCTTANPKFGKGDGGTTQGPGPDGGTLTVATDASTSTVDSAVANGCTAASRTCDATGSESCPDGTYVPDRTCPQGSKCAGGYCAEPPGVRTCTAGTFTSDALCTTQQMGGNSDLACQPFVQDGALVWACDAPFGTGTDETACTVGSACRSGVCASNGFCLRPCAMDNDCGKQGNARTCAALTITVEGVTTSVRGCVSGT